MINHEVYIFTVYCIIHYLQYYIFIYMYLLVIIFPLINIVHLIKYLNYQHFFDMYFNSLWSFFV